MEGFTHNLQEKYNPTVEEAYKVLRTNIQFCGFDKKIKSIAVTSCNPGEGKTTTSINLAISMAKTGMKVLLVDADMRKPMHVKHLGWGISSGLSNIISRCANMADALNRTNIEGLDYIACGPKPPNPAELIGSPRFKEFIGEACEEYDIVILDTPPLGSVIDCAIVATSVDGVLLVVQSKAAEYCSVQRVKEQLEKVNARILGVVLNKLDKKDYKAYYGYYNYYKSTLSFRSVYGSWIRKLANGLLKRNGRKQIRVSEDAHEPDMGIKTIHEGVRTAKAVGR